MRIGGVALGRGARERDRGGGSCRKGLLAVHCGLDFPVLGRTRAGEPGAPSATAPVARCVTRTRRYASVTHPFRPWPWPSAFGWLQC